MVSAGGVPGLRGKGFVFFLQMFAVSMGNRWPLATGVLSWSPIEFWRPTCCSHFFWIPLLGWELIRGFCQPIMKFIFWTNYRMSGQNFGSRQGLGRIFVPDLVSIMIMIMNSPNDWWWFFGCLKTTWLLGDPSAAVHTFAHRTGGLGTQRPSGCWNCGGVCSLLKTLFLSWHVFGRLVLDVRNRLFVCFFVIWYGYSMLFLVLGVNSFWCLDRWGLEASPDKHIHSHSNPRPLSMSLTEFLTWRFKRRSKPHPMSPQLRKNRIQRFLSQCGPSSARIYGGFHYFGIPPKWLVKWLVYHGTSY